MNNAAKNMSIPVSTKKVSAKSIVQAQSTRNSVNTTANNLLSHHFIHYVIITFKTQQKQAKTLKPGNTKPTARGKSSHPTTNQSNKPTKKIIEVSVKGSTLQLAKNNKRSKGELNKGLGTARFTSLNITTKNHLLDIVNTVNKNQYKQVNSLKSAKPTACSMKTMEVISAAKYATERSDSNVKIKVSLSQLQKILKEKTCAKNSPAILIRNPKKFFAATNPSIKRNRFIEYLSFLKEPEVTVNSFAKPNVANLFPLSAGKALKVFSKELTNAERCEILYYETIYYMGNGIAKFHYEATGTYDNDKADYKAYVGEHLGYRYEILTELGSGSFGQAFKCLDHKTHKLVAVKIIKNKKRFKPQANIEIQMLTYIKEHDAEGNANVMEILDSFVFRNHIVRLLSITIVYCN